MCYRYVLAHLCFKITMHVAPKISKILEFSDKPHEDLATRLAYKEPKTNQSEKIKSSKDNTVKLEAIFGKRTTSFLRDKFPIIGFSFISVAHLLSGLHMFFDFLPKPLGQFLDKHSLQATKLIKSVNYLFKGVESMIVGRGVEALTKLSLPFIYLRSKLENFHTLSGIISGLTMLEASQVPKTIKMKDTNNFFKNFKNNFSAAAEMYKEIFNFKNLNQNHLFFSGGNIKFIGSLLGAVFEQNTVLRRIYTLVRNAGSIAADVSKFFQNDINWKISGTLFPVASLFDTIQNFTDYEKHRRAFAHLSFTANALANYFYLNITKARTDGTYKI